MRVQQHWHAIFPWLIIAIAECIGFERIPKIFVHMGHQRELPSKCVCPKYVRNASTKHQKILKNQKSCFPIQTTRWLLCDIPFPKEGVRLLAPFLHAQVA